MLPLFSSVNSCEVSCKFIVNSCNLVNSCKLIQGFLFWYFDFLILLPKRHGYFLALFITYPVSWKIIGKVLTYSVLSKIIRFSINPCHHFKNYNKKQLKYWRILKDFGPCQVSITKLFAKKKKKKKISTKTVKN